jgi:hypothetical protein
MSVHDLPVPPAPALPPVGRATTREQAIADADNPHKLVAQYRKARKIADALLALGATIDSIPELEGAQGDVYRRLAAAVAGTNVPSENGSWALVLELIRESG